jgi:TPR repeat protein
MIKTFRAVAVIAVAALLLAGCGKSSLIKGNEAFRNGDHAAAESHWLAPAEAGDVDAQHNLGVLALERGDLVKAAAWWQKAVAREFVPSMRALARLELAAGRDRAAVALYHRAARWGDEQAIEVLEALGEAIPAADLRLAYARHIEHHQDRAARELNRTPPNDTLNRVLDIYAMKINGD